MEEIKIFNLNYDKYLLLLSNEDIYYYYSDIYSLMNDGLGKPISIVIDMFIRNGFTFNRFIELIFDERGVSKSKIINPRDVSDEIKENTKRFLKENSSYLDESPLSKRTINFVLGKN